MDYTDTYTAAVGFSRGALEMLARHRLPPDPNNYAVCYAYVAGSLPDLRLAVDAAVANGGLTEQVCDEIFGRFLDASGSHADLREANRRIEDSMAKILAVMTAASQGAERYGAALQNFSGELVGAMGSSDGLSSIVKTVLMETRSMAEANRQLEGRLSSSAQEIEILRSNLDMLKREVTTDALTGIANRKKFDAALSEAALTAQANSGFLCLLMIDIDFFKKFNDNYGHQLGDQVLKLVARTMMECIKGQDTAARYGGEEFSVILPSTALRDALVVADNIRRQVAGKKVVNRRTNQNLGQITLSIGVAQYTLGEPLTSFIQRADEALYLAKRAGRNRVLSQDDLARAQQMAAAQQ